MIIKEFSVRTFLVPATDRAIKYNLFIPKNYDREKLYPLVMFIHDAGACSNDVGKTLIQGNGATIWAIPSEQSKRPCFVLAPQYSNVCVNDNFEVTWELDATIELIKSLMMKFSIDKSRIYGTGQSMGCMMLCEMSLRNRNFFAGCLLVAGQWNPSTMSAAKNQNFWIVVAEGDTKAFPIMKKCIDNIENAGGKVSREHIDAKADNLTLDKSIYSQNLQNCNINFTWFEGKTILPNGELDIPVSHHVFTWEKAYDIEALRKWLFEQSLK